MMTLDLEVTEPEALQGPQKYAVIVNGYADSSSFYNNISFVHDMLLEKGYKEENIIILHDHGEDPDVYVEDRPDGDPKDSGSVRGERVTSIPGYTFEARSDKIVDGPAYKSDVFDALDTMAEKARPEDEFFFYSTDHGGTKGGESTICLRKEGAAGWWGIDEITVSEFQKHVDKIKSEKQVLVFDQCHSGGFADALGNGYRIAISACSADESSYIAHPMDGFPDALFSAMRGRDWEGNPVEADFNGDGKVSIAEAFQYALENDPYAPGNGGRYEEHPQINTEIEADSVFLGDDEKA
ncbi:MAG: C13 family peptidase [Candidatus Undinarchaeales archaeon]|jgi:hypothetical protein|nr:C13 family peptidase [Candidatus Undinarchaeales archaeon]